MITTCVGALESTNDPSIKTLHTAPPTEHHQHPPLPTFGFLKKYRPDKGDDVAKAMIKATGSDKLGFNIYEHDDIQRLKDK